MSKSWNRWIAAAFCVAWVLAAGCSKPAAESPAGESGPTETASTEDPGSEETRKPSARKPTIDFEHLFQIGTGVMSQKAYLFKLAVWPTTDRPLSGVLQVRTFGDVSGVSGRGNNADILPLDGVAASKNNAAIFYYFLNSPEIRNADLSPDEAGNKVNLAVVIQYTPPNIKTRWEETEWVLAVRDGKVTEVDLATASPEMQQWLSDRGIPTDTLQLAKD